MEHDEYVKASSFWTDKDKAGKKADGQSVPTSPLHGVQGNYMNESQSPLKTVRREAENSVKHGIAKIRQPEQISIGSRRTDGAR